MANLNGGTRSHEVSRSYRGYIRRVALSFTCIIASPAFLLASTLNGFVTRVTPPAEIEVGNVRVRIRRDAICKQINSSGPVRERYYGLANSCNISGVEVGYHVQLTGQFDSADKFIASHFTIFESYNEPCPSCLLMTLHKYAPGATPGVLVGGALAEEHPRIGRSASGWQGRWWLDGYPIDIGAQTRLITSSSANVLHELGGQILSGNPLDSKYHIRSVHKLASSRLLAANTWIFYRASYKLNQNPVASQLILWPNRTDIPETKFLLMYAAHLKLPDYRLSIPGSLQYVSGGPIQIVPDQTTQKTISQLGESLVPEYQKRLSLSDSTRVNFQFYVVHPFLYTRETRFVSVGGHLPKHAYENISGDRYNAPRVGSKVTTIVAMPDGKILIPDVLLARERSQSEVAALLSFAITSILQKQAWSARGITGPHHAGSTSDYYLYYTLLAADEQLLRIGIRQMYLAGYDIREAPFAWAVAQGKPVNNPVIDSKHPDKEIPWYAAYAFNYISQYYQNVDYSKLKRGRREYQQFLQELRKADPEAFAVQKSSPSARAH